MCRLLLFVSEKVDIRVISLIPLPNKINFLVTQDQRKQKLEISASYRKLESEKGDTSTVLKPHHLKNTIAY